MSVISIEAEQATLGGLLLDNSKYWQVVGIVTEDDFTKEEHRSIFHAIGMLAEDDQAFDAVTVSEHADAHAMKSGGLGYVASLAKDTPSAANTQAYAQFVADKAKLRRAIGLLSDAQAAMVSGDVSAVSELQAKLEQLHTIDGNYSTFAETLTHGLATIQTAMERAKDGLVGVPTGLPALDERTGGWHGQKLIILAARPSLGKTALALQGALAAAKRGHPVGICSLEMGTDELAIRSMAHEYQVSGSSLSVGQQTEVMKLQTEAAKRNIREYPIFIDDNTFTVDGIVARLTEWHRKYKIQLGIVDHLQLVDLKGQQNRNDALGEITRALKLTAKRLNMPILLLCQLSRANEAQSRQPRLSDLRDSGNIEQDADIVLALHGELDTPAQGQRPVHLGFLKHRGGQTGWLGQVISFNGPHQRFEPVGSYP